MSVPEVKTCVNDAMAADPKGKILCQTMSKTENIPVSKVGSIQCCITERIRDAQRYSS